MFVPYAAPAKLQKWERLVPITEFEPFAQLAFQGYTSLNRIQSQVYEAAYHRNENLLICAPTGLAPINSSSSPPVFVLLVFLSLCRYPTRG